MLRPEPRIDQVYLHRAPIDMRKQRNGLAALVQEVLKQNPFSGALFLFTSKRRDRIEALYWDRNGFVKPSTKDPRRRIRTETTLLPVAPLVRP